MAKESRPLFIGLRSKMIGDGITRLSVGLSMKVISKDAKTKTIVTEKGLVELAEHGVNPLCFRPNAEKK